MRLINKVCLSRLKLVGQSLDDFGYQTRNRIPRTVWRMLQDVNVMRSR
ncbi:MAG: hypothetical protein WBA07_04255 [Rivularia sp. (in: cyanobacteria)]